MTIVSSEAEARALVAPLALDSEQALAQLDAFVALLAAENQRQNLVAAGSLGQVWQRHIADSAQLLRHVSRETPPAGWVDLGTGAGFPGLVLAVLRPDVRFWLIEARRLRAEWLGRTALTLGLHNVEVVGARVEAAPVLPGDVISARAFAPLARCLALGHRFATPATRWLLPRGRSGGEELAALVGWRHRLCIVPSQTDRDSVIVIGEVHGPATGKRGKSL